MTADIRTAAQREIRLDHLLGTFAVGSGEWSWQEEYDKLMHREYTGMMTLILNIKGYGIHKPILLGSDGRVWDGHHRICAAMHIGLDTVPVEFCTPDRVTPTREQVAMTVAQFFGVNDEPEDVADAVLALLAGLAEGESDD